MTAWQWECFEGYANSSVLGVTNAGPLHSPIRTFTIARNDKLELILETLVVGDVQKSSAPVHPVGTVRLTTETVEFAGQGGMSCVAHGVWPFSEGKTWNAEHVQQTTQRAKVHSLTARLRNDIAPAYAIDWLENLDSASSVWTGSFISDRQETIDTRTIGHGAGIELSARDVTRSTMNNSALSMVINGVQLYLCVSDMELSKGRKKPGYIFYVGNPDDAFRKKIREVLSFCLGNYLVYLGSTTLCEKSEIVTFSAVSPPSIGRVFEIPVLPPAQLGDKYQREVDQQAVSRMANAVYAHYDELRFGAFSWAYWHARCAPVHMAAAHFGAVIEAVQDAYVKSHPAKFETTLITDKAKWSLLSGAFLTAIIDAGLDPSISAILTNKVRSNLNQTPPSVISEKLLADIGITLSPAETDAWKRRNMAAHGGELALDSAISTIRDTKLLKIILHRIVLKITGASDFYHDDYSIGHCIRKVTDPAPRDTPATFHKG
jgi:hypothetical protein